MRLKLLILLFLFDDLVAVPILVSCITSLKLLESEDTSNITSATTTTHMAIAVDYHYKRGEVYFSDGQGRILRSWLRGENAKKDPIVLVEVLLVDGLAVDWVNDNLYWTDVRKSTLEMATLDGLDHRVLFSALDGLDKPRAIVVDPYEGLLFASDWGTKHQVFSAGLDGKMKNTISSSFLWPNGLALDLLNKKLYILDGLLSKLSSCNYDGSNLQELWKSNSLIQSFGLTYFSNKLYWTSWKDKSMMSINIQTRHHSMIYNLNQYDGLLQRMMGLKAIHASLQPDLPRSSSCDAKYCAHRCIPSHRGTASCICQFGFNLHHDDKTCVEEGYLLVSWRRSIRRYDIHGTMDQPLIDSTKATISIDFHFKKGLVFWSDVEEHRIYRAPLEQLNNKTVIASVEHCDGLAVDWVHDVLYWTDVSHNIIVVASLDGSNQTSLITQDLEQPRAVALDPSEGMLFWSDWGTNPKIESANLDGLNRKVIVGDKLIWPNGITIDINKKKLYWVDGMLGSMFSCSYDGSQRKHIPVSQIDSMQPFGISFFEDYLYWTDWTSLTLRKTSTSDILSDNKILANSSSLILRPNGIKVVHSSLQRNQDNPCMKINCKGLCLGSPSSSSKAHCVGGDIESELSTENAFLSETDELDEMTINVKNDSFQLSFSGSQHPPNITITWKCSKREGCIVDTSCLGDSGNTKVFTSDQMPFTVAGLLPASKYDIRLRTPTGIIKEFVATTKITDPPELPKLRSVNITGTNVTIKWHPVDTCVPNFHSYNFRIYKTEELTHLLKQESTNLTEVQLFNLQPFTSYTMQLFTDKETEFVSTTFQTQAEDGMDKCETENFICDGIKDCSDGRDEDITICAGIEQLIVYKKTKSEVYFRCVVSDKTAKHLQTFSVNYSVARADLVQHFEFPAEHCSLWPEFYCFHIFNLTGSKLYIFNVSAVSKSGIHGNQVSTNVLTKEGVPGPPEDVQVISYAPTTVEIQWRHPNQSNGVLRNFIINIQEVETFEEDKCCLSFPMTELPVEEEKAIYSAKPGGFSPASTYAISITTKTLYLGGSKEIDVNTPPPPMEILRMPELEVATLTQVSWQARSDSPEDLPQYHTLIKCYILLVKSSKANLKLLSPLSDIEIRPLKPLLELKIGADFVVLWKKNADDSAAFKDPIQVLGLISRKQYELAWVQVSQYKDVFGLDYILSEPFIVV